MKPSHRYLLIIGFGAVLTSLQYQNCAGNRVDFAAAGSGLGSADQGLVELPNHPESGAQPPLQIPASPDTPAVELDIPGIPTDLVKNPALENDDVNPDGTTTPMPCNPDIVLDLPASPVEMPGDQNLPSLVRDPAEIVRRIHRETTPYLAFSGLSSLDVSHSSGSSAILSNIAYIHSFHHNGYISINLSNIGYLRHFHQNGSARTMIFAGAVGHFHQNASLLTTLQARRIGSIRGINSVYQCVTSEQIDHVTHLSAIGIKLKGLGTGRLKINRLHDLNAKRILLTRVEVERADDVGSSRGGVIIVRDSTLKNVTKLRGQVILINSKIENIKNSTAHIESY